MHKQDLLIAVVSVSAIVYVILFDDTVGGFQPAGGQRQGINPLIPASIQSETVTTGPAEPAPTYGATQSRASRDAAEGQGPLLSIRPEGSLTPQSRARLVDEVRAWLERPVPGALERLKEDHEAIGQLADSLSFYRVALDEKMARAFREKVNELKRCYLLARTTTFLEEVARSYSIPAPAERVRIRDDLKRLKELSRDVTWVEERYSFVYPSGHKDYLRQIIEVLEGMDRMGQS